MKQFHSMSCLACSQGEGEKSDEGARLALSFQPTFYGGGGQVLPWSIDAMVGGPSTLRPDQGTTDVASSQPSISSLDLL